MATEAPVSDRPADRPVTPGTAAHHPVVHHPVVRRTERVVVAIVTAAFAIVLFTWAAVVPMYQAADERAHFDAVVHVAIGDGWPDPGDLHLLRAVDEADTAPPSATMGQLLDETGRAETDTVDQMTQHPPTYYAVAAGVLHLVDFAARTPDQALLAVRSSVPSSSCRCRRSRGRPSAGSPAHRVRRWSAPSPSSRCPSSRRSVPPPRTTRRSCSSRRPRSGSPPACSPGTAASARRSPSRCPWASPSSSRAPRCP